jgi:hypothetical protein
MWQANTPALLDPAGKYDVSIRRHARRSPETDERATNRGVLGYPATWPAGAWVVPLFWLLAVLGTWLLRLLS